MPSGGIGWEFAIYDWGNGAAAEAYNRIIDRYGKSLIEIFFLLQHSADVSNSCGNCMFWPTTCRQPQAGRKKNEGQH